LPLASAHKCVGAGFGDKVYFGGSMNQRDPKTTAGFVAGFVAKVPCVRSGHFFGALICKTRMDASDAASCVSPALIFAGIRE
jgi:hypothetical protein